MKAVKLPPVSKNKKRMGIDVFLNWRKTNNANDLGASLQPEIQEGLTLEMIATKGLMVWPDAVNPVMDSDLWRCRIVTTKDSITPEEITSQLQKLFAANFDVVKIESLYQEGDTRLYSLAQGQ